MTKSELDLICTSCSINLTRECRSCQWFWQWVFDELDQEDEEEPEYEDDEIL